MCLRAGPDEPESPAIRALMCHCYVVLCFTASSTASSVCYLAFVSSKPDVLGPVLGP
jgi:hypothetical protein